MFSIKKIFLSFSKKPVKPVEPVEPVRYRFHHDRNARPLKSILKHPQPTTRLNTQISFAEEGYVRDPYTRAPYNRSVWRDEEPLARDPFQPSHGKTLASHPDDTSAGTMPSFAEAHSNYAVPMAPARQNSDDSNGGYDAYNPASPSPQELSGIISTWGRKTLQQVFKAPTPRKPLGRPMRSHA